MKTITVREAVDKVDRGESLAGFILSEGCAKQVNVRDAIVLHRGGITVPEEALFYDDAHIEYDEEIDELEWGEEVTGMSWEERVALFVEEEKAKLR